MSYLIHIFHNRDSRKARIMLFLRTLQYHCAWYLEKGKPVCLRRLHEGILSPGSSMAIIGCGRIQSVAVDSMGLTRVMYSSVLVSGY